MIAVFAVTVELGIGTFVMIPQVSALLLTTYSLAIIGALGPCLLASPASQVEVPVDPLWLGVAVVGDAIGLLLVGWSQYWFVTRSHRDVSGAHPIASLVLLAAGVVFLFYAHWKSSHPRPPRRVRATPAVPASRS